MADYSLVDPAISVTLSEDTLTEINDYILRGYPNEVCGYLDTNLDFVPTENISETPETEFKLNSADSLQFLLKGTYLIHSHCKPSLNQQLDLRTPTEVDVIQQQSTKHPWLIFGCNGYTVQAPVEIPRVLNNKYVGREFIWYIQDCYSLVQDFYWFTLNKMLIGHKPLPRETVEQLPQCSDIFEKYIKLAGFYEVPFEESALKLGDVLLINKYGHRRNHLAIYLENGQILEQSLVSRILPLSKFYNRIDCILRLKALC